LLIRALFYKCVSNCKYFEYINIGIEVISRRGGCKEVYLCKAKGVKALLRADFIRRVARASVEEATIAVRGGGIYIEIDLGSCAIILKEANSIS